MRIIENFKIIFTAFAFPGTGSSCAVDSDGCKRPDEVVTVVSSPTPPLVDDDTVDAIEEYRHDSVDDESRLSWNSVYNGDRRSCRFVMVLRGCIVTDELSSDRCNVIRKSATAIVLAQCVSTGSGLDCRRFRGSSVAAGEVNCNCAYASAAGL